MSRRGKLSPAAVKNIFKSKEPARLIASRFKVSQNLIYLIRAGRIHREITSRLKAPVRPRGRVEQIRIDVDKLADAILKRLTARLRGRA